MKIKTNLLLIFFKPIDKTFLRNVSYKEIMLGNHLFKKKLNQFDKILEGS